MQRQLLYGSGLYTKFYQTMHFGIIGTGAAVSTSLIKEVRYCLQVTLGALYLKLPDAKNPGNPPSSVQKDTRVCAFIGTLY